ncbi:hypothetical protein ASE23_12190 [Rhizobium sp. Root73]|nr:hypothetical protein ASE23_12190 [Rhizobium sp. Root73]
MQSRVDFGLQDIIDGSMASDAAHADESAGNNSHPHMGFAGAVDIGMVAGMQVAFVDNNQSFGRKGRGELGFDAALK